MDLCPLYRNLRISFCRFSAFVQAWFKSPRTKAWFPYRCICGVCRTKKIHRTDRIHSIPYNKLYLSFLLYWAFVREVSIKFISVLWIFFVRQTRQIRQIQRYGNQAYGLRRIAPSFLKVILLSKRPHTSIKKYFSPIKPDWVRVEVCLPAEIH